MDEQSSGASTAASQYGNMMAKRQEYISRAEECSSLTIPSTFIDRTSGKNHETGELYCPVNSVGARGVRNLGARLATALMPPNSPFFRYSVDESIYEDMPEGVERGEIELAVNRLSMIVSSSIESSNLRTQSAELFHLLLTTGSPLIFVDKDLSIEVFSLNDYVMERDRSGRILKIIVKEVFARNSLPESVREFIDDDSLMQKSKKSKEINVYTYVRLNEDGQYESHQEVADKIIEESRTVYPEGINPWIAPRVAKVSGEHYGRSYVEEFLGDLRTLEGLTKSVVDMAAASSRAIILVNPGAVTSVRDLNKAKNGDFVPGFARDFESLSLNLAGDFSVVSSQARDTESRLQQAFLLMSSIQRNAERVTAQEIRLMAEELNNSLGGMFSILADEFQRPLIEVFQWRLEVEGKISIPADADISLITGIDALGRGQDIQRLNGFISSLVELQGAGINVLDRVNGGELTDRLAAGHGLDTNGLILTDQQLAQRKQQEQMAQASQAMQGPLGGAVKDVVSEELKGGQPQQPPSGAQ